MSANCAPTYNFYNCCDPNGGGSASNAHKFIWGTESTPTATQDFAGGVPDALYMGGETIPASFADKREFLNLAPLPVTADLLNISILRFAMNTPGNPDIPASYTASVDLDVVVLDFFGNVIRTISIAPLNYKTLPNKVWTPIPLTAVASDLKIVPGELVAARVKFGATSIFVTLMCQLTGVGQIV